MRKQPWQDLQIHWNDAREEGDWRVVPVTGPDGLKFTVRITATCRAQPNVTTKINDYFKFTGLPAAGAEVPIPADHFFGF
jgi:hypothetical protein